MAGPLLYAYCTRISVCNWFVCIYYSASKSDILYVYFYFYVYCAILLCLCCVCAGFNVSWQKTLVFYRHDTIRYEMLF